MKSADLYARRFQPRILKQAILCSAPTGTTPLRSTLLKLLACFVLISGLAPGFLYGSEAPGSATPAVTDRLSMALPAELIAAVGIESNVYFDNAVLCLNPANYAFDVVCPKGRQYVERWTWTPTEADVGAIPFELIVRDESNQFVSRGSMSIKVVAANTATKQECSLLLIGDSLTHGSVYAKRLLNLSNQHGQARLTLVGSHRPIPDSDEIRHEGYGGWTAHRFATHFTGTARQGEYAKRGSPFLYKQPDDSLKLDFQQYCKDVNEGKFPDAVTIFLGPNDIFSYTDENLENGIEFMLTHYDQLIAMVSAASPTTRIGVMLPVPGAASQDAFGKDYGTGQTRWQYKRNQHKLVQAMLKRYQGRQSERIQVIGTHLNLDAVHNYPTATVPPNAQSEQKIVRQNNGVHPAESGYRQIGDSVYAWLISE
ncbi:SGNH/GDSL hydrolase family protein [Schlesneria sp.]|uniref:SGNH/GDSL hydrolase family protein n=1 Tax=Schlesneria sp. TaxID=2762018 RepID=UPI002F0DDDCA